MSIKRRQNEKNKIHMSIRELPYAKQVVRWLLDRYGQSQAKVIWRNVVKNYNAYLDDCPNYGGKRNGHANAIYGGLLVFALYSSLPSGTSTDELAPFVQKMFMSPFVKLGKIFNLNRTRDMRLIDLVFKMVGRKDRRDIRKFPSGFVNVSEKYDSVNNASRYHFTQCPNAEFARKHNLLHVLPLLCNCDFYGIEQIHGCLIREGTCGNSDRCDYLVVGSNNLIASEYEQVVDEKGYIISRKREA